ncbi:MAG: hypothetical protein QOK30_515, partial [Nocardioidaceae bacterium]|nr:hypothetical protein [Nocardioidaceae bacterium]
PRQVEAAARRAAIGIDPASALRRGRTARTDRRVTIRPAPDTMALVSGCVPVEQGVAAWASLDRAARSRRANGDPRSLSQLRADTFIERLTGQATATAVPVEIGLTVPSTPSSGPTPPRRCGSRRGPYRPVPPGGRVGGGDDPTHHPPTADGSS